MKQALAFVLTWGTLYATAPTTEAWASIAVHPPIFAMQEAPQAALSAAQIDELVSPIALYPDALVAQILAASTYPDQVVAANTWLQANSSLNDAQRAEQANNQSWDPSVKALTQFPTVLANMAQNLSWTSALGDAFYNQQADVMASVQRLRQQAKAAGNLKTTPQQTVTTENQQGTQVIVIQPANPQVVYVPAYNPTVVYGTPYYPPGYSTGAMVATGIISFGVGMAVGAAISGGWGWNSWGCGWHGGTVNYNRNVYVSNSNVYRNGGSYNRNYNYNGNRNTNISGNTVNVNNGNRNNVNGGNRNNVNTGNVNAGNRNNNNINSGNRNPNNNINNGNRNPSNNAGNRNPNNNLGSNNNTRPNATTKPASADRGYGQRPTTGTKTGAFSGYGSGGTTRAESSRGRQSSGGGGGGQRSAPAGRGGGGGGGGRKR